MRRFIRMPDGELYEVWIEKVYGLSLKDIVCYLARTWDSGSIYTIGVGDTPEAAFKDAKPRLGQLHKRKQEGA